MARLLRGRRGAPPSSETSSIAPSPQASSSSSTKTASLLASTPTSHLLFEPHASVRRPELQDLSAEDQEKLRRLRRHMVRLIRSHYYYPAEDSADEFDTGASSGQTEEDRGQKRREDGSKDPQGQVVEHFYQPWEYRWLDLEKGEGNTIRRYLRAGKGNEEEAIRRLESSLTWRRSFKPDIIVPEDVRVEGETGKSLPLGFDVQGRVVLYLNPGKENTKASERQIRYVVWGLERAIDLLPPYQSKLTLVIDFKHSSQAQNPSMSTSLRVLSILQNHYVERLGLALALNPPWYLNAFWSSVQPFLDPVTKTKVKWNPQGEELRGLIPPEQLPRYYGGDYHFLFDKDVFWTELIDWCGIDDEGKRRHESWSKLGGRPAEGQNRGGGGGGGEEEEEGGKEEEKRATAVVGTRQKDSPFGKDQKPSPPCSSSSSSSSTTDSLASGHRH